MAALGSELDGKPISSEAILDRVDRDIAEVPLYRQYSAVSHDAPSS